MAGRVFGQAMGAAATSVRDVVHSAISHAARKTGIDFDYLFNQAKSESGLNPSARASTSSASGLFQFIDQSWLGVVKQHGERHGFGWAAEAISRRGGRWTIERPELRSAIFALRNQAGPAALMAAESASDNADGLARALGRPATGADLYMAHFLGLHGATRYLQARDANPSMAAAALFPREAAVNKSLFYTRGGEPRSLDQLYALMARKIGGGSGGDTVTPAQPDIMSEMQMASAGDLIPVPEGSADGNILAALASAEPDATASSAPATDTASELLDRRASLNLLRPSPQTARLAYMMLAADLGDVTENQV